ncbi:hypothetical protein ASG04_12805 [Curtobacterium sp. Leaf183]|nr:hypothetical protein ASG04_12805 [Curtobacterium sp. Leaf183]
MLVRASVPLVVPPRAISHASAAAVHALPFVQQPPDQVQLTDPRRARPDGSRFLRIHHGVLDMPTETPGEQHPSTLPVEFVGARVTSLVRTLADVASTAPWVASVPMIDAALGREATTPALLRAALDRVAPQAHARARVALEMGSALSGSPAESVARVRFRQLGTPEPVQQHEFSRAGAQRAVVDFWFPDQGVVVEVDGRAKYEDPQMLAGISTADAHWREKQREDFVRSFTAVRCFVRLTWADLMDPETVRAKLTQAGIPCR